MGLWNGISIGIRKKHIRIGNKFDCVEGVRPIRHRDLSSHNTSNFENWYQDSRDCHLSVFPITGKLLRDFSEDGIIGKCRSRHFPIFQNSGGNTSMGNVPSLVRCVFSQFVHSVVVNSIGFEFYSNFPAAARVNSVRRTRLSGAIFSFLVNIVRMVMDGSWISITCKLRFDAPAFRVRFLSFWSASSAWSWIGHGFRVASWISQIEQTRTRRLEML